jgi:branched-chain amino acid transport system ATP-binding protein
MYLLKGDKVTCGYDTVDILLDCTIGVQKGQIASIVGPNGAGKSTAMKSMFGLLRVKKEKSF